MKGFNVFGRKSGIEHTIYEKSNHNLLAQNGIGVKVNHFGLKNDNEKSSRKIIFEIRELSQITFALRGG